MIHGLTETNTMNISYKTSLQQEEALREYPPPKYRTDRQIIYKSPMWCCTVTLFNGLKFSSNGAFKKKLDAEESAAKAAFEATEMVYEYNPPTRKGRQRTAIDTKEYFEKNKDLFTVKRTKIYTSISVSSTIMDARDATITLKLCSTMEAAREEPERCTIIVAGNPKKPGGGWLDGSINQEAECWRQSGLHMYIDDSDVYERNRNDSHYGLYNSIVQWCSSVPVIKNEEGAHTGLYFADFVTSFPPNAKEAKPTFTEDGVNVCYYNRVALVLSICHKEAPNQTIVLGAWGCGVLGNDPTFAAMTWKKLLQIYNFKKIIFAIPDRTLLKIYQDVFVHQVCTGGDGGDINGDSIVNQLD